MRTAMIMIAVAAVTMAPSAFAATTVDEALEGVRSTEFVISPKQKYTSEDPPNREHLTFDSEKNQVIWVRTYGKRTRITQVYRLDVDRAKVKDDVVIIPLKWRSITNPANKEYNPDKHDCGVRINQTKEGIWVVNFWAIDTAGVELNYKFVEPKD